jgi:hypothetical protein
VPCGPPPPLRAERLAGHGQEADPHR